MTYFSLRKHAPEEEPEPATEEAEELVDEGEPEPEEAPEPERPATRGAAVWQGVCGPGAWLAARFGTGTAWTVHVVAGWACFYYGAWVAAGIILAWLLAVGAFIPREHLEQVASMIERRTEPVAPEPAATVAPGDERETVRRLLLNLIGDAHGVHLRTVLAHLQEHGQWEDKTVADLRVHLEALRIPVRPKVKIGGTPTRGVLRADLTAPSPVEETAPSPAPSPPV
ncbi:hypothetical protein [Streptomyces sp. NPDC057336]|uniref:hypothetical protein n=1 Tax=Streptomyces sp. NPDC057336 TaxID=3346102 RepID=UPI00362D7E4B